MKIGGFNSGWFLIRVVLIAEYFNWFNSHFLSMFQPMTLP